MGENLYIIKRKIKSLLSSILYLMCRVFPIKNNKIVFSAFEGMGYCCHPKYIAEELINRQKNREIKYELVWLVNDVSKFFPKEIKPVRNTLLNRAYHLSTSKVWIDNARKKYGTLKRKKQFYILTWHGMIGFKSIGRLRGEAFPKIAEIVSKHDAKLVDVLLSNSNWCSDIWEKAFWNEPIAKLGSPRCDILFNNRNKQYLIIRNRLQLSQNAKIVMYAPTFRGGSQNKQREVHNVEFSLDFKRILDSLEQRFGGEWYMLLRLHPQLSLQMKNAKAYENTRIIDISKEDDMYEFLAATDVFISDYSSASFDASFMKIPVFLYADDIDKYVEDRGSLVWDIEDIPFPLNKTNNEICDSILEFNKEEYIDTLDKFFKDIELLEDGEASKRVVDMLEREMME